MAFSTSWINAHLADSTSLGKPFVLEEFGKQVGCPRATLHISLACTALCSKVSAANSWPILGFV